MLNLSTLAQAALAFATLAPIGARAEILGCTALAIDGEATVDGSAFAGMNADCQDCDGRVAHVPGGEHAEGSMRPVYIFNANYPRYIGYDRGEFYYPVAGQDTTKPIGYVPQVKKTFAYWEGTLPLMNEKGLAFGESSCASRLLNYPVGQIPDGLEPATGLPRTSGLIDLNSLMQIAAERCETAKCAMEVMGKLADDYGYFPMVGEWNSGLEPGNKTAYDDGGEAITVSDTTGEAWVFHVCGGVDGITKSVWAAWRVPKGHAAFVANNYIIRSIPSEPNEDFLFSKGIFSAAKQMGYWKESDGPLDFARVFAPDSVYFQSPGGNTPVPLYASLRNWGVFKVTAPEKYADVPCPLDPLSLPPSEKVEKKLAHRDVFKFLSYYYQDTEFDLTKGILAGPFGSPYAIEGGAAASFGQIPRAISIARTIYSTIGQSRLKEKGDEPVLWFAPDTPLSSVYVPFFPRVGGAHAKPYASGFQKKFSRDSAYWAMDFVTNFASLAHWQNASGTWIFPNRERLHAEIEQNMTRVLAEAHGDADVLANWQIETQQTVVDQWWELADTLVATYNDGFYNDLANNKIGLGLGYPAWYGHEIGFNHDVHPIYVKRDYDMDRLHKSVLPVKFDIKTNTWLYHDFPAVDRLAAEDASATFDVEEVEPETATSMTVLCAVAGGMFVALGAFTAGTKYERSRKSVSQQSAYTRIA